VRDQGANELKEAVERGRVSVSVAADLTDLPEDMQRELVAKGEKEILAAAKAIRAEKAIVRREERLNNLAEISRGDRELSTATRYPIIYADPPRQYENPPIGASNHSIENHYPTMTLEEICAINVHKLATDDAVLYLWATVYLDARHPPVIGRRARSGTRHTTFSDPAPFFLDLHRTGQNASAPTALCGVQPIDRTRTQIKLVGPNYFRIVVFGPATSLSNATRNCPLCVMKNCPHPWVHDLG
jgi:hypothetical protein